ncbi:SH3 domain-containing protein [Algoriphagus sp.]|uniref:SH3 domain-containing protein n=1 Tax=Algoriphagus sp. TaxID=1872435 RepID=UPI00262BD268|nr:SH3 domain-containing protein [Algoriphagus sp.]
MKDVSQADSLFDQQNYQEAMNLYVQNYESGLYSPAMLLKMAFIAEGMGDKEQATLYLSKYYDLEPTNQIISKIKDLTGQNTLYGFEVSDSGRFLLFLVDYKEYLVGCLAILLIVSLLSIWWMGRNPEGKVSYWPSVILLLLLFVSNNFLRGPRTGLITTSPTYVVSKPTAGGSIIDRIEPGHRVKIKASKDIWYEVEWKNSVAFVKKEHITRL